MEYAGDDRRTHRAVHRPISSGLHPASAGFREGWIRARCRNSGAGVVLDQGDCVGNSGGEVPQRFKPLAFQIMPPERIQLARRLWSKANQRRSVAAWTCLAASFASSSAMLSRNICKTGSAGMISPAASWSSLSAISSSHSPRRRLVGSSIALTWHCRAATTSSMPPLLTPPSAALPSAPARPTAGPSRRPAASP